ncbi:MAG: hypothetical protein LBC68_08050 [Prevotellaceae bacterium]|jgi:hypothetical protein|nr:hypothetical protein [Prevotellaceae bacterium]
MIYKEVIEKRLARKQEQLNELEKSIISEVGLSSPVDKRKYIELKAVIQELENVLDIADSMFKENEMNTTE